MEGTLLLSLSPDLRIEQITAPGTMVIVHLISTQRACPCPLCGHASEQIHSRYRRMVADVPCCAKPVRLELEMRKFFCRTPTCPRKIFTERLPDLVEPLARITKRLRAALQALGVATGAAVGSRLAPQLGMDVKPTTLLRFLRTISLPVAQSVQVLGLDDWAFKRGQIYGTILVDLERHRVIDPAFGPPSRNSQRLARAASRDRGDQPRPGWLLRRRRQARSPPSPASG